MKRISKGDRHRLLREILSRNEVSHQRDLQDLLWADGVQTTVATLSRDLRELGAIKTSSGYRLEKSEREHRRQHKALASRLKGLVTRVDRGGNLVVIHTSPGHGAPVALEFERQELPEVMGAIAGVDTVFVAARTATGAREIERTMERIVSRH